MTIRARQGEQGWFLPPRKWPPTKQGEAGRTRSLVFPREMAAHETGRGRRTRSLVFPREMAAHETGRGRANEVPCFPPGNGRPRNRARQGERGWFLPPRKWPPCLAPTSLPHIDQPIVGARQDGRYLQDGMDCLSVLPRPAPAGRYLQEGMDHLSVLPRPTSPVVNLKYPDGHYVVNRKWVGAANAAFRRAAGPDPPLRLLTLFCRPRKQKTETSSQQPAARNLRQNGGNHEPITEVNVEVVGMVAGAVGHAGVPLIVIPRAAAKSPVVIPL